MTNIETATMLHTFQAYWPTLEVHPRSGSVPGTADIWAEALRGYRIEDARRAVLVFRGEKGRAFAPTMSEFEGVLREFATERAQGERVRVGFSKDTADTSESYEVNGRHYVRISAARRKEIRLEAEANEMRLESYSLGNGETGFRYVR